jgi:hypothetical protein
MVVSKRGLVIVAPLVRSFRFHFFLKKPNHFQFVLFLTESG